MADRQPSEEWLRDQLPLERRRLMHVAHSIEMLSELPGLIFGAAEDTLWVAAIESWFIHGRLLAEFLLFHPSNSRRDFSASDYDYSLPTDLNRQEVSELWTDASQLLVHFSKTRAPENPANLETSPFVTSSGMLNVSLSLIRVAVDFATHISTGKVPGAEEFSRTTSRALETLKDFERYRLVRELPAPLPVVP